MGLARPRRCSGEARPFESFYDPTSRSWRARTAARRACADARREPRWCRAGPRGQRPEFARQRTRRAMAPGREAAPRATPDAGSTESPLSRPGPDPVCSISVARVRWVTSRRRSSSAATNERFETVAGAFDGPRVSCPRLTIRSTVLRETPSALAATPKWTSSSASGVGLVSDLVRAVSDAASAPATGSESSTTSASAGCASGSSHERSTSCSSGVDPGGPDVVRRERTGSGPYGRSARRGSVSGGTRWRGRLHWEPLRVQVRRFGRIAGRDGTRRGRGGSRHGRDGTRHGRDGVATWSRRCLGDGPARTSSVAARFAGD